MTTSVEDLLRSSFAQSLPLPETLEPHLREALRHVLSLPGSLSRPRLLLQVAAAYGVAQNRAVELATAIEYFHTASLLIDDLPCMDDATERRSMPCLHVQFGEATTVLASLALVNRGYALAWRATAGAPVLIQAEVLRFLEGRLGVEGLLHGQSLDLRYRLDSIDAAANQTRQIAQQKTGSLIRLALVLPALLGGAAAEELRLLERLSALWGLSYQFIDDVKDVLHELPGAGLRAAFGKTPGRDLFLGRPNAVHASGLEPTLDRLERMLRIADRPMQRLLRLRPELSFLNGLKATLRGEAATLRAASQQVAQPLLLAEPA